MILQNSHDCQMIVPKSFVQQEPHLAMAFCKFNLSLNELSLHVRISLFLHRQYGKTHLLSATGNRSQVCLVAGAQTTGGSSVARTDLQLSMARTTSNHQAGQL